MHKIKELDPEANGDAGRFGDELSELLGRSVAVSYIPDGKGGADLIIHDRKDQGRNISSEVDAADVSVIDAQHRKQNSDRLPLPKAKTVFVVRNTKETLKTDVANAKTMDQLKAVLTEVLEGLPN